MKLRIKAEITVIVIWQCIMGIMQMSLSYVNVMLMSFMLICWGMTATHLFPSRLYSYDKSMICKAANSYNLYNNLKYCNGHAKVQYYNEIHCSQKVKIAIYHNSRLAVYYNTSTNLKQKFYH